MPDPGYGLLALETFSGQLGTVKKGLEESHSTIDSCDSDYGHGGVRDAMHHFEKHWRDGRKHVEHTAGSLAGPLQAPRSGLGRPASRGTRRSRWRISWTRLRVAARS